MRKALPYLIASGVTCLFGLASWFLWRNRSSRSSSDSSESIPTPSLRELEAWQRGVELELGKQFDRVRAALGRLDRSKRSEKDAQEPQEGLLTGPLDLNDQGNLNKILARKVFGGP